MVRGGERAAIFRDDADREAFVTRIAGLAREGALRVLAWALMPNHVHLLVYTGPRPLAHSMKRLLTGYAVTFNRRHRRAGHLFQNRYKSIVCDAETYLLELTRYIHLNPLRGGCASGLAGLRGYPWTGHAALLGTVPREWQDTATILGAFGRRPRSAQAAYAAFVGAGAGQGRRPELVGGGLVRSLGGWAQVLSLRRTGATVAADARVLGRGDFVTQVLAEAARQERDTLRLARRVAALPAVAQRLAADAGLTEEVLRSARRGRPVVRARRLFCQVAVTGMGHSGAAVARFLGVTTSAVNRLAASPRLPETARFLRRP